MDESMTPLKKVSRDVRLHESTVKKAAEVKPVRRKRKPAVRRLKDAKTMKMDLRVWRAALELAGNDRFRIQVINESEVIVWNNHNWKHR